MYQALYRTWRPRTFEDVVGQEPITVTLKNEVRLDRVAHSYLFTGSRGTGKTTCSKILAKAVNCLSPKGGDPCGECAMCKGIEEGSVTDVVEIDAASNNGVEDVRSLREEALFTPVSAKKRVYIVDEAHMLSVAAFNALLKIMEEPPAHVLFILATTEAHKVPATIVSRCQRFDFKRIDSAAIRDRLIKIAEAEGIALETEAAMLIARLAEGGMRDAISLLDQCATAGRTENAQTSEKTVTTQTVAQISGLADHSLLFELCETIYTKDSARALELIDILNTSTVDFSRLLHEMMALLRNIMVAKATKSYQELIACTPEELLRIEDAARRYPMELMAQSLSTLTATVDELGRTTSKRLAAELCMIRLTTPTLSTSMDALLRRVAELEARLAAGVPSATGAQEQTARQQDLSPPRTEPQSPKEPLPVQEATPKEVLEVEERFAGWEEALERLAKANPALHGTLIGSTAYIKGDLILIDAQSPMFAEMMRKNEYTKMSLREAIRLVTGKIFRLGPVKKDVEIKETGSLLERLAQTAKDAGIEINE